MDDDDSTEASIRRLLDLPKRPLPQAKQIHNKIDGEDDEHAKAADSHTAPVDVSKSLRPSWSSINRRPPRNKPCAAEKTRLVMRKPLTKGVSEARRSAFGARYLKCPRRGLNR